MKVGSLVECVLSHTGDDSGKPIFKGIIYTVRDIITVTKTHHAALLEEVKNGLYWFTGTEYGYCVTRFREILPQINIAEVIEKGMEAMV